MCVSCMCVCFGVCVCTYLHLTVLFMAIQLLDFLCRHLSCTHFFFSIANNKHQQNFWMTMKQSDKGTKLLVCVRVCDLCVVVCQQFTKNLNEKNKLKKTVSNTILKCTTGNNHFAQPSSSSSSFSLTLTLTLTLVFLQSELQAETFQHVVIGERPKHGCA